MGGTWGERRVWPLGVRPGRDFILGVGTVRFLSEEMGKGRRWDCPRHGMDCMRSIKIKLTFGSENSSTNYLLSSGTF